MQFIKQKLALRYITENWKRLGKGDVTIAKLSMTVMSAKVESGMGF